MLSRVSFIISLLLMGYASFFFYPRWQQLGGEATLSWDVSGYYWYLPSVFIYKDIKHQTFKDSIFNKYHPASDFQQGIKTDNGNYVMKYSSGMALMYLPFFTVANLIAKPLGYPADGFSTPYQLAIQIGGFLIAIIGLWYLRKLLLRYYEDRVVAIVMLLLVLGSNYLNYAAIDTGMSHSWLFTIYVFILLNTDDFYKTFKMKYAIRIGLMVGLATLTRPTEIISCLIPILWGMEKISINSIKQQFALLITNYKPLLIAILCCMMMIAIQPLYWKYVSGHWMVYSYGDQGFSWKHPNLTRYMLNYRSGWLTYTPMMVFAIIGIIPYLYSGKNKLAILSFSLLNYYIVSAWNIWWYGGRAMIQSYPLLLFPMAALVTVLLNKKYLTYLLAPIALVFIYFNIWLTYHYHKGNRYETDGMTKLYFWRVVGMWGDVPESIAVLKDNTELYEGTPKDLRLIYENDIEHDTTLPEITNAIQGKRSVVLNKGIAVSPYYAFAFAGNHAPWLRVQATFRCSNKEFGVWKMAQFVVRLKYHGKLVKENMIRVFRLLNEHETKDVTIDMKLPEQQTDTAVVFFWNADSDKQLFVDNIKAWTFQPQK